MKQWRELKVLATRYRDDSDFSKAIALLEEAVSLEGGAPPAELALMFNMLAALFLKCRNLECAEQAARESIKVEKELVEDGSEEFATYCVMLAKILCEQSRFQEASKWSETALLTFSKLRGEGDAYVAGAIAPLNKFIQENSWRG